MGYPHWLGIVHSNDGGGEHSRFNLGVGTMNHYWKGFLHGGCWGMLFTVSGILLIIWIAETVWHPR